MVVAYSGEKLCATVTYFVDCKLPAHLLLEWITVHVTNCCVHCILVARQVLC